MAVTLDQFEFAVVCAHYLHGGWPGGCSLDEGGRVGRVFLVESWEGEWQGLDRFGEWGHLDPENSIDMVYKRSNTNTTELLN